MASSDPHEQHPAGLSARLSESDRAWLEEVEEDRRFTREHDAKIEAEIEVDLDAAEALENKSAEEQPGDAELVAFFREGSMSKRRSLAIDRRERCPRVRRLPARRMIVRRRGGCERHPSRRVGSSSRSAGGGSSGGDPDDAGGDDPPGEAGHHRAELDDLHHVALAGRAVVA
jgi:hypothetical protein